MNGTSLTSTWRAGSRALQVFAFVLFVSLTAMAGRADARPAPESFADLVETLLPTVVNISTRHAVAEGESAEDFEEFFNEFFERRGQRPPPQGRQQNALGSGFVIDAAGYIVTNHHVIDGADEISVILSDDTELDAKLIGSDEKTDLALLKVETDHPLMAASWGNSDAVRIGDWVIAIGNPFGLGGTVTAGIVSAQQRDINAGPYDDFIQTDAAINRGNSGGPMFDIDGRVIGINSAIFSPSGGSVGIGFAIPANLAVNVVDQLREFGEVRRGWLGVRIQTVTDELAEGLRLEGARGALVASVTPEGPAAEAGIQQGDVILEFDGRAVEEMRKLPRMVAETRIGTDAEVTVWRRGEERRLTVQLGELDEEQFAAVDPGDLDEPVEDGAVTALGLELATITPNLRERFQLEEGTDGVVITTVDEKSSAAEKGLRPGDVIVEVDQEEVASPTEVAQRVNRARDEGYRVVTLLIHRGGDFQWVAVRLENS